MNDITKDMDYQEFFAGIKELAKGLMQIRERTAIEYAPIVEEFCARNTISETIATCTRPKHTLQKSFVKLFPQTVFSNKLYCLGEITFDIDRRSFFTVAFDITIFSPKSSVNPYSQCP